MALIECPECGKKISDKAATCPNCGFPITTMATTNEAEENKETQEQTKELTTDEQTEKSERAQDIPNEHAEDITHPEPKSKKPILIGAAAVLILGVGIFFGTANMRTYSAATKLYNDGEYQTAVLKFQELGDYKDSSDLANACSYQIAMGLEEQEDFEGALALYKELGGYQDSKEKAEKCEYELSVDGQFLRAFKKGLMARWDLADGGSPIKDCAKAELDVIESFYDQEFVDKELQEWVVEYIDSVRGQLDAVKYQGVDDVVFTQKSNESYGARAILLKKFFEEHEMEFDEKYQKSVEQLTGAGEAAEEQKALTEAIQNMMKEFKISQTQNEYGWRDYSTHMKNETEYTFEYFYVDISAIDQNGTIVTTGQASLNTKWSPGQEAEAPTWFEDNTFDIEGYTFEFQPHYNTGSFYQ